MWRTMLFATTLAWWAGTSQQLAAQARGESEDVIQVRIATTEARPGLGRVEEVGGDRTLYVEREDLLNDVDILAAHPLVRGDQLVVTITLTPEGASRVAAALSEGGATHLVVSVNGVIGATPEIRDREPPTARVVDVGLELPPEALLEVSAAITARWPSH